MQKSLRDADIVPIGIGYYTAPEAAALATAAKTENSAVRAARLFDVPVPVVNDAVAFEQSLMAWKSAFTTNRREFSLPPSPRR